MTQHFVENQVFALRAPTNIHVGVEVHTANGMMEMLLTATTEAFHVEAIPAGPVLTLRYAHSRLLVVGMLQGMNASIRACIAQGICVPLVLHLVHASP